jgi:hypothetical protein
MFQNIMSYHYFIACNTKCNGRMKIKIESNKMMEWKSLEIDFIIHINTYSIIC